MDRPRILFLDAYDSFSNNIVSLLTTILDVDVEILPIDSPHISDDGDSSAAADGQAQTDNDFGRDSSSSSRRRLANALRHYDAVVCGPGPGSPASARDVGLMRHVWALGETEAGPVPALGICLGFQSLVLSCGGAVQKLRPTGLHGMIRAIDHDANSTTTAGNVFRGVPPFKATLYHSLHADIGQDAVSEADWPAACWRAPEHLPDIVPLAWAYEDRSGEGGRAEERILMGVRHREKPFWGLQYHPESICTEPAGHQVIRNWFEEAVRWNRAAGRVVDRSSSSSSPYLSVGITRSLALCPTHATADNTASEPQENGTVVNDYRAWVNGGSRLATLGLDYQYQSRALGLPEHIAVPDIVELLQGEAQQPTRTATTENSEGRTTEAELIILDSASASASAIANTNESKIGPDVRGRYSIIALEVDEALKLQYTTGDWHVTARVGNDGVSPAEAERVELGSHSTVWQLLGDFWARREFPVHSPDTSSPSSPFLGGFMGYLTYELGLEGIGVQRQQQQQQQSHKSSRPPDQDARPDLCFVWVTKSIVIDHLEGTLRVQILAPPSSSNPSSAATSTGWLDNTADRLLGSAFWRDSSLRAEPDSGYAGADSVGQPTPPLTPTTTGPTKTTNTTTMTTRPRIAVQTPDAAEYEAKVRRCQEFIASGDSYELCLTDQTLITTSSTTIGRKGDNSHKINNYHHNDHHNHNHSRNHGESKPLKDTASWKLYRRLRTRQPAPFGSYVRLGGATLVSSSPERFLEFDGVRGRCSMRPMKGTVRKVLGGEGGGGKNGAGAGVLAGGVSTLEQAERLLHVPKEEAENLMIVDLVRHDLHGVCGAGGVSVPHLLRVEEYASVFQMVSVVEGRFPPAATSLPTKTTTTVGGGGGGGQENYQQQGQKRITGLDVLAASLPPGSMTGAPKKRSCELLLGLEGEGSERSLYSGVVGYMDVAGRGDWSVTIRSLFRWDDETTVATRRKEEGEGEDEAQEVLEEVWHIGAGGAVTALSTAEGERDEMFTKLRGPLGVFEEDSRE